MDIVSKSMIEFLTKTPVHKIIFVYSWASSALLFSSGQYFKIQNRSITISKAVINMRAILDNLAQFCLFSLLTKHKILTVSLWLSQAPILTSSEDKTFLITKGKKAQTSWVVENCRLLNYNHYGRPFMPDCPALTPQILM